MSVIDVFVADADVRRVLGDAGLWVMRLDFAGPMERVWDDGVERLQRAVEQDEYAL